MSRTSKKTAVDRSRITWVLAALLASMTIGTVVLGVLEPHKRRADKTTYLAAVHNSDWSTKISRTSVPIENEIWQSIAIHTIRPLSTDDMTIRCGKSAAVAHFVVAPDATILISKRWREQEPSSKYPGKILIGIQVDEGQSDATLAQAQKLVILIRELQARCNVSASKVQVHTQTSGKVCTGNPLYRYNWREALLP